MASSRTITGTEVLVRNGQKARIRIDNGVLYFQRTIGGVWRTVGRFGGQGNTNNNFQFKAESAIVKIQQLITGGEGWDGVEGTDFETVGSWHA